MVHGEHAFEDLGRDEIVVRMHQLNANNESLNPAQHQKDERVNDVENAQPLMIDRRDPLMQQIDPRLLLNLQRGYCDRVRCSGANMLGTENPSASTVTIESGVLNANGSGNATGTADQSSTTGLAQDQKPESQLFHLGGRGGKCSYRHDCDCRFPQQADLHQ